MESIGRSAFTPNSTVLTLDQPVSLCLPASLGCGAEIKIVSTLPGHQGMVAGRIIWRDYQIKVRRKMEQRCWLRYGGKENC